MKTSETLYEAADYIREHGFSPEYSDERRPECGCFLHAINHADDSDFGNENAKAFLRNTIFYGHEFAFSASRLADEGWTKRDAIAALEIAADIAFAEGN